LLKIGLESIFLKKAAIISMMVIHRISGFKKTIHQQSPPSVFFPEINRSVHRLHTPFSKPAFASVNQAESRITVIYTFKKAHAARRLIKAVGSFLINESRNPPYV